MCGSKNRTFSACRVLFLTERQIEYEVLRTSRSPPVTYCLRQNSTIHSTRQAENVRFLEPQVLCLSRSTISHNTGERMCGSSNRTFFLTVAYSLPQETRENVWF